MVTPISGTNPFTSSTFSATSTTRVYSADQIKFKAQRDRYYLLTVDWGLWTTVSGDVASYGWVKNGVDQTWSQETLVYNSIFGYAQSHTRSWFFAGDDTEVAIKFYVQRFVAAGTVSGGVVGSVCDVGPTAHT